MSLRDAPFLLLVACAACESRGAATASGTDTLRVEWPVVGGDDEARHYSPLSQVDRANVARLERAWLWSSPDRLLRSGDQVTEPGSFEATPIMVGDTLFLSTALGRVVALDAETGRAFWTFVPELALGATPSDARWGLVHRGVAQAVVRGGRRIYVNVGARLHAIDAATGTPVTDFGDSGSVDLNDGLRWPAEAEKVRSTSAPVVAGDVVIVGSAIPDRLVHDRDPPGAIMAFDVATGTPRWTWHSVPPADAPGGDSWEAGANDRVGHANVWSPMTVDPARGLLYANVSAASNDFYGGRRKGANLYSESLVCLDAATGRLQWHFQYLHHGLWDYEAAAPPMLISIPRDGRLRDIVVVPGKTGFLYAFDRVTGAPVWPIEERPVRASDVPGEEAWPTQPHPSWPPPFTQQGITESDLVDFTPEVRRQALDEVRGMRLGALFDPPSREGTVLLPGWLGGAGWGGGAWDPTQQRLYVKATRNPVLARVVPADPAFHGDSAGFVTDYREPPHRALDITVPRRHRLPFFPRIPESIPIVKPPYGTLASYDMNDGSIDWNLTVGDSPRVRLAFPSLALPPLGAPGPPGPIVTAGGLVFLTGGGESLLALDSRTGAQLWEGPLGKTSNANPMTYRTSSGRQFIVVGFGSGENGRLVAFTLAGDLDR